MGHLRAVPAGEAFPLLTEGKVGKISRGGEIDTLGFSVPSLACDRTGGEERRTRAGCPDEVVAYRHALYGGGFSSTIIRPGAGARTWLEASIPKRIGSDNVEAVDVETALWQAGRMLGECQEFVELHPDCTLEDARIVRCDGVRDFDDVEHIGELLDGLERVPRSSVMKKRRWADAERNRAESLRVGPKAWGGTAYDKHAETPEAAEGRLRFEVRLHSAQLDSQWARSGGFAMKCLGDITGEKVSAMTRSAFGKVAFDREVVGIGSLRKRVAALQLSAPKRGVLWAYLTLPGFAAELDPKSERQYRRLAEAVGAVPGGGLEDGPDVRVRLDYDSGTEVFRVA